MKVGFIGLGLMGNPMAKNIAKKGFDLTVYNRSKEKTGEFAKNGIAVASSIKQLAKKVDILVSIVTGPKDVEQIYLGKDGVISSGNNTLIAIDMSTIGPSMTINVANALKKVGICFLDAPVTGSVPKAQSGKLTVFIGGDEKIFKKAKPVLRAMGTNLQYMGKSGSGQAIKLVNNQIVASTVSALAEGFLLADTLNLPREKVAQALADVPALSFFMKLKLPNMVNNTFPVAFSVANMEKDLKLALSEAAQKQANMPILSLIESYYHQAQDEGLGGEDISAVLKVMAIKTNK